MAPAVLREAPSDLTTSARAARPGLLGPASSRRPVRVGRARGWAFLAAGGCQRRGARVPGAGRGLGLSRGGSGGCRGALSRGPRLGGDAWACLCPLFVARSMVVVGRLLESRCLSSLSRGWRHCLPVLPVPPAITDNRLVFFSISLRYFATAWSS